MYSNRVNWTIECFTNKLVLTNYFQDSILGGHRKNLHEYLQYAKHGALNYFFFLKTGCTHMSGFYMYIFLAGWKRNHRYWKMNRYILHQTLSEYIYSIGEYCKRGYIIRILGEHSNICTPDGFFIYLSISFWKCLLLSLSPPVSKAKPRPRPTPERMDTQRE